MTGWTPGPAAPQLAPGEVHVWLADLSERDVELESLSAAERLRAESIVRTKARARWICSRALLRHLLSSYLRCPPAEVELAAGGRPRGPELSVSHSRDLALYALASDGTVGVDVEALREDVKVAELTRRLGATRDTPVSELLARWTRREAIFKAAAARPWLETLDIGPSAVAALAASHAPTRVRLWTLDADCRSTPDSPDAERRGRPSGAPI